MSGLLCSYASSRQTAFETSPLATGPALGNGSASIPVVELDLSLLNFTHGFLSGR